MCRCESFMVRVLGMAAFETRYNYKVKFSGAGQTQDDTIKVTWVTGDASSETSSNLEGLSTAG